MKMEEVAIDSVKDVRVLLEGIPLDEVSVSITTNRDLFPVMYII